MKILIVEDNVGMLFLMKEVISGMGHKAQSAETGAQALLLIEQEIPDLLILDYSLPDMNARQLVDKLRAKMKNATIPFIVSTGQGDERIAVEMMKLGAHDYLVKDAMILDRLKGVIERAIEDIKKDKKLKEALETIRKSELKLLEEQKRLANIVKAAHIGTWEWNLQADLAVINERWAHMLGYEKNELHPLSKNCWLNLIHPDDSQSSKEKLGNHINGQSDIFSVEVRLRHKDGHYVWVQISGCITEYDAQNKPLIMAGTQQDITDRKQKEDLEKEMQVARKSIEFKQNFLANMSHEIRTPLTGVLGMIEILSTTELTPLQKEHLNTLKHSSENLREIINQVLDFSKIEAGKAKLKIKTFAFEQLATDARKLFDSICTRNIRFNSFINFDIPEIISADQGRINQIVNNLVSNAVKYTQEGEVLFKAYALQKDASNQLIKIKIEIQDTGLGIHPSKHSRLFTPFSQIDEKDTRSIDGTGLGLAICKELSKLHGGEIGFESQPGKGSTFWFTFLAHYGLEINPEQSQQEHESKETTVNLDILFVEDKAVNQKVAKLMLESLGHKVTLASNGQEALDLFKPGLFDLILMDIQMPVMDGITAVKNLRGSYQKLPPIVGLSANAFEGDRERYMEQGMDEYLTKPFSSDDLNRIIHLFFKE